MHDSIVRDATQWSRADPDGSGSSAAGQLHDGQLALLVVARLSSVVDTPHDASAIDPDSTMHNASLSIRMTLLAAKHSWSKPSGEDRTGSFEGMAQRGWLSW